MDRQGLPPPSAGLSTRRRREAMGIVISWSLILWVIAAVIGFCALSFFLLQVASAIAAEAPDVSIHPRTPLPKDGKIEYSAATGEAFRERIPKFGMRRSLPLDSPRPRSFVHHYRADVVETWKQRSAAALNKVAILRASQGLERRFRKGSTTLRTIFARSGSFIFVKSRGFFRRLDRGRAIIDRRAKAIGRLYSLRNH
jgi:hypothetical protein